MPIGLSRGDVSGCLTGLACHYGAGGSSDLARDDAGVSGLKESGEDYNKNDGSTVPLGGDSKAFSFGMGLSRGGNTKGDVDVCCDADGRQERDVFVPQPVQGALAASAGGKASPQTSALVWITARVA